MNGVKMDNCCRAGCQHHTLSALNPKHLTHRLRNTNNGQRPRAGSCQSSCNIRKCIPVEIEIEGRFQSSLAMQLATKHSELIKDGPDKAG
jgi:hypothetical protein